MAIVTGTSRRSNGDYPVNQNQLFEYAERHIDSYSDSGFEINMDELIRRINYVNKEFGARLKEVKKTEQTINLRSMLDLTRTSEEIELLVNKIEGLFSEEKRIIN